MRVWRIRYQNDQLHFSDSETDDDSVEGVGGGELAIIEAKVIFTGTRSESQDTLVAMPRHCRLVVVVQFVVTDRHAWGKVPA